NNITTIGINGKTGEVFFGTNMGLVSFKGTATKGNESYAGAYIYPNPVRENYNGPITITGLASNVNVKVTDISGQLVYETTSFGGQAIWNGKNFSGRKVSTGVYLVFCTDEQGKNKKVLKLLVIN
ncbi:MAG: T9SS type A sorting domain-containing protein, partial [Bacteroidales bacterium]|nr:T9SS type A sorting domain-containing protein [Bacteroidales bacterium]